MKKFLFAMGLAGLLVGCSLSKEVRHAKGKSRPVSMQYEIICAKNEIKVKLSIPYRSKEGIPVRIAIPKVLFSKVVRTGADGSAAFPIDGMILGKLSDAQFEKFSVAIWKKWFSLDLRKGKNCLYLSEKMRDKLYPNAFPGTRSKTTFGLGGMAGRGFGMGSGGGGGAYGNGGGFGFGSPKKVSKSSHRKKGKGPKVHRGRMDVKGLLTKKQIRRVVDMYWFQLRYCYERELQKHPKIKGGATFAWSISKNGYTAKVKVSKTNLKSGKVEHCIVRRISMWKFPKPRKGIVTVRHSFTFRPK